MVNMQKQKAGFKFGKNRTRVIEKIDEFYHDGRCYRLVLLEVDGKEYHSLRLYNAKGKFIKQFMTEPSIDYLVSAVYNTAMDKRIRKLYNLPEKRYRKPKAPRANPSS